MKDKRLARAASRSVCLKEAIANLRPDESCHRQMRLWRTETGYEAIKSGRVGKRSQSPIPPSLLCGKSGRNAEKAVELTPGGLSGVRNYFRTERVARRVNRRQKSAEDIVIPQGGTKA